MNDCCIALLRGVNVGGRNKLPMKDLARIVEDLGGKEVRTYIQSGNVVFTPPEGRVGITGATLAAAILEHAGVTSPVVLRTAAHLESVIAGNPYLAAGHDPKQLHVAFLAQEPAAARVAQLDPERSPGDEYTVAGSEIYLRCPNGLARTKLTNAYFDSTLATTSTVRNWATTAKLLELARG